MTEEVHNPIEVLKLNIGDAKNNPEGLVLSVSLGCISDWLQKISADQRRLSLQVTRRRRRRCCLLDNFLCTSWNSDHRRLPTVMGKWSVAFLVEVWVSIRSSKWPRQAIQLSFFFISLLNFWLLFEITPKSLQCAAIFIYKDSKYFATRRVEM